MLHKNLQNEFKTEISKNETSQLIEITVPLAWIQTPNQHFQLKEKNEFSLDGKMYDFVSAEMKDDTIIYTCRLDEIEEILYADFNHHQTNDVSYQPHSTRGKSLKNRLKIFISTFILPDAKKDLITNSSQYFFRILQEKYITNPAEINSPPPEFYYS